MTKRALEKDWFFYKARTQSGEIPSLYALGIPVGEPQAMQFMPSVSDQKAAQKALLVLLNYWDQLHPTDTMDGANMNDEKKIVDLSLLFLKKAEFGTLQEVQELVKRGIPINFQHPRHAYTALHMAVTENHPDNHAVVRYLLDSSRELDFMLEDEYGRFPWHNAIFFNFDETLRQEIYDKTKLQADAENFDLDANFRKKFREEWMHSNWFTNISRRMDFVP